MVFRALTACRVHQAVDFEIHVKLPVNDVIFPTLYVYAKSLFIDVQDLMTQYDYMLYRSMVVC